jgi:phosphatidylglycerophosphate synthase
LALAAGAVTQLLLLVLVSAVAGLGVLAWLAGVGYGAVLIVALYRSGKRTLGPADYVTLGRATLVGCVTAMIVDTARHPAPLVLLVTVASVALALDAVDGPVARRTGTVSPLGARFDMEVDAFLILVLSVLVASTHGSWVLAIGAMRYAFVAASWVLPWMRGSLPPSIARKTVAAVQGVVLVVAASGILPYWASTAAVALALAALVWSFADSVRLLYVLGDPRPAGGGKATGHHLGVRRPSRRDHEPGAWKFRKSSRPIP